VPKIKINKNHNLPMEELRKRAEELVEKLQDRMASLNMDYEWRPDKSGIDFKGSGFKGKVELSANGIGIMIDLSLMLAAFKGKVEERVERSLQELISA